MGKYIILCKNFNETDINLITIKSDINNFGLNYC